MCSTYFHDGRDWRLEAASRHPGSKSKAHLSQVVQGHCSKGAENWWKNAKTIVVPSVQVCSRHIRTESAKTDFDLAACRVLSRRHELWDAQTAATRPPRHHAIPPVADELVSSPSSVSSVNVPHDIPPIQNMCETRHIKTAHSDLDAFNTFWCCNVIRYVSILRFHKLKNVQHSSECEGDGI